MECLFERKSVKICRKFMTLHKQHIRIHCKTAYLLGNFRMFLFQGYTLARRNNKQSKSKYIDQTLARFQDMPRIDLCFDCNKEFIQDIHNITLQIHSNMVFRIHISNSIQVLCQTQVHRKNTFGMLPQNNHNKVDHLGKQNIIQSIRCNFAFILDIPHIFLLLDSKLEYKRGIYCRNRKQKRVVQVGRQHRSKLQDLIEESHLDRQNIHQLFRLGKFYQMSIVDNKSLSKLGDQEGIFRIFQ